MSMASAPNFLDSRVGCSRHVVRTPKKAAAVIHSAENKSTNKRRGRVFIQRPANTSYLTQLVKVASSNNWNTLLYRQICWNEHSKKTSAVCWSNCGRVNVYCKSWWSQCLKPHSQCGRIRAYARVYARTVSAALGADYSCQSTKFHCYLSSVLTD